MARTQLLSNSVDRESFLWFQYNTVVQKDLMIHVVSCEHALKSNSKAPQQNMFLFKSYTLEFEFAIHLELMVSYHGLQSELPVFVGGEFGTIGIFL